MRNLMGKTFDNQSLDFSQKFINKPQMEIAFFTMVRQDVG